MASAAAIAAGQRLTAAVQAALKTVSEKYVFVDTVQALLERPFGRADLSRLRDAAGSVIPSRVRGPHGRYPLRLQQPTPEALTLLARMAPKAIINRVDVALDLITETWWQARELEVFLREHVIIWRRRKNRSIKQVDTTTYFEEKWKPRNLAFYSDQPSKVTGQFCTHMELRLFTADACRRAGITSPASLCRCDALWILNHNLRLAILHPDAWSRPVNRLLDQIANPSWFTPAALRGRAASILHRQLAIEVTDNVSVQAYVDHRKQTDRDVIRSRIHQLLEGAVSCSF